MNYTQAKLAAHDESISELLPNDLKAARKALGLSQYALGIKLGYSDMTARRHVRRMEAPPGTSNHRRVPPWVAAHIRTMLAHTPVPPPDAR